jgi:putative nucleotidyltransferase with HDIG domain
MAGLVSVAELQPDMVLTGDLRAYNGRLLLSKGLCLSAEHIKIMKMWGIVAVPVNHAAPVHQCPGGGAIMLPGPGDGAVMLPADLDGMQQQIRGRFRCTPLNHPAISQLYQSAVGRLVRNEPSARTTTAATKTPAKVRKGGYAVADTPIAKFIHGDLFWDNIVLPTLPNIFIKINETIMNPRSSAYEIAGVISKDTSLTARLLKMANSAFYGFPVPIDSIQRAVTIIGAKQLTTLSNAINIIDIFKNVSADIVDMASFWLHSVACGICARILAGCKNIQNTERLFVAGLLHDIGRLLLYQYASADMGRLLVRARSDGNLLYKLESEALNVDHAAMGARLVKKWKLPALLEDIVNCHHAPQKSCNAMETAIVHVADIMTNAMGVGSSGEFLVPPLDLQAWENLGLSEHVLASTIEQMDQQLKEVLSIFFHDEKTTERYH